MALTEAEKAARARNKRKFRIKELEDQLETVVDENEKLEKSVAELKRDIEERDIEIKKLRAKTVTTAHWGNPRNSRG